MNATATVTGKCECGSSVTRPRSVAGGALAARLDAAAFRCDPCVQRDFEERERGWEREQAVQAEREHRQRLRASSIPAGRLHLTLDQLESDAHRQGALVDAQRWAAGELLGLVLIGPYGVGKTQIAASAAAERLRVARGIAWYRAGDLVDHLSRDFGSPERADAQRAIDSTGPLVLDDLDKTRPSEYAAEQLFRAIDSCDAHGRQLIVTSNLTPGELVATWPARYGNAIASRLVGHCAVHRVEGRDRRVNP